MMNPNILPENEYTVVDDRLYTNPNISLQEQTDFISNLRNVQNRNNAEISQQTYNLGTDISSSLGGLGNSMPYFTSRYQTPQNVSVAANLRAAAQAQVLNEVLSNELAAQKKRYNDAYRAAQRRANTPTPTNPENPTTDDGIEENVIDEEQFDVKRDVNNYGYDTTIYDSTKVSNDSRSTERGQNIKVIKNNNGSVRNLYVNGVNHTGREAQARYRYLKNAGLVK